MINIINPTIDLFLYDLRNSLGDDQKDIEQNRRYFYQKFHETVQKKLKQDRLDNDQNLEVEYIRLLNSSFAPLSPDTPLENGYYFPVRLGDSYGLLLEVAAPYLVPYMPEICCISVCVFSSTQSTPYLLSL